jgi:amino acid transporter
MATLLPLPGGFVYYTGRFLDPSARFALGWNYVIQGVAFVCFELTALNVLVEYWAESLNPAICISAGLVGLGIANGISVRWYGEIGEPDCCSQPWLFVD